MAENSQRKVLIVGAGIAGLVLAQILRANGIEFEIFERDEPHGQRRQGWSVALSESVPHLDELLPKDLGDIEALGASHPAGYLDSVGLWSIPENRLVNKFGGEPRGYPGWMLRVWRPEFKEFLSGGFINVQMGKQFSHFTEDNEQDNVTAFFEDGTNATGSLLVGADGVRSRIRSQFLGKECPPVEMSAYQMIMAETNLSREQYTAFREYATATVACRGPEMLFVAALQKARPDGSAAIMWSTCWTTADPEAHVKRLRAASKEARLQEALQRATTHKLPGFLHEIVDQTEAEEIVDVVPVLTEFVPPSRLPRGRVTLIGDALHAMIPFRGAGANTAIRDACDLGRQLIKHWFTGRGVDSILGAYEAIAAPRGQEQVLASREAGRDPKDWASLSMRDRKSTIEAQVSAE